jgi:hypothetical protein
MTPCPTNTVYFKYDRGLLTEFCHCARESLEIFFRTVLGLPDGIPCLVMVIHTFGDYARFHPHLHAIVADGLFRKNGILCASQVRDEAARGDFPVKDSGHAARAG